MEVHVIEACIFPSNMPGPGEALIGRAVFPPSHNVGANVGDATQDLDRGVTQMNRSRLVGLAIGQPD